MSQWPCSRAAKVGRALMRIGWREKPRISKSGAQGHLEHPDYPCQFTFAFQDQEKLGPKMPVG
jgi:hypothetical protein